ncbi:hypothetical protein TBLA_0A10110 [Henningerozyma blattae CBS 6284]|uniref:RNI-like protein n=1 Tax=Henningerozyma blattae (strain ATCC 34711 / CBS 6284 / DSM 70876 / NBRC 10599 / NRRL Y-10934 / UCD 77-7) TaxID=1071380 RepID=I2GXD9_HENB6|nr:hypothetical protein TBLA_0A10110 [Tetrapisispora blattae CBS 6284]CCH58791.1 hypothetical protein TBLA_0A10110 [Tetrapisispora blattae CBS 6284]
MNTNNYSLRKTKSINTASVASATSSFTNSGTGFFKSIFSRSKPSKQPIPSSTALKRSKTTTNPPTATTTTTIPLSATHKHRLYKSTSNNIPSTNETTTSMKSNNNNSTSNKNDEDEDSRLLKFLQYYKSKNYSVTAFNTQPDLQPQSDSNIPSQPIEDSGGDDYYDKESYNSDNDVSTLSSESDNPPNIIDKKGRPIPPHPNESKYPSILKNHPSPSPISSPSPHASPSQSPPPVPSAKFGTFLRKVTSSHLNSTTSSVSSLNKATTNSNSTSTPVSTENNTATVNSTTTAQVKSKLNQHKSLYKLKKNNVSNIPGLEKIKPLKHVSFATNTYFNDPPQQICSKNPRKGEVQINPDGTVVIHRLSQEERKRILESSTFGIVVGGTGQLKLLNPLENENLSDINVTNTDISHATIDKPMLSRRSSSESTTSSQIHSSSQSLVLLMSQDSFEGEIFPPKDISIPFDIVYTRCCHLREILPIPAMMKQLKKGSTETIPLLQLRNPRPSMVEVWAFSDFISIVPVLCISLDGVNLTVEQFKIILSSLMHKKNFEKLSLRNTPINSEGWKLLCYFISKSQSLISIDLSMVPTMKTNVQKPSKSSLAKKKKDKENNIIRMVSNLNCRDDINWNLLTAAIASKNGIEEIIVSGAQMSRESFQNFIQVACIATERLGLAYNNLTKEQCENLGKWIIQSKVTGLDVSFNDLRGKLDSFSNAIKSKIKNSNVKNIFKFISLRGTNLSVKSGDRSENNEALRMISCLCYCENLKFLDLSNNPDMFPYSMHTLIKILPVFANLVRLHLDFNNLSSTGIIMLSEILPFCSKLNYLSILGTKLDQITSKSLIQAIEKSSTLITLDIDFDDDDTKFSKNFKNELSIYTMRNMENEFKNINNSTTTGSDTNPSEMISFQQELSELLTDAFDDKAHYDQLAQNFIQKITDSRIKIRKVIQDLFELRLNSQLSFEGKETLIRFCFIDACFEKCIRLIRERTLKRNQIKNKNCLNESNSDLPISESPMSSHLVPTTFPQNLFRTDNNHITTINSNNNNNNNNSTNNNNNSNDNTDVSSLQTVPSSTNLNKSGHSVLLPFGKPEIEDFHPNADDTKEYRNDQDYLTIKIKTNQNREEGDIFKKSVHMIKKIKEDSENKNMSALDKDAIRNAAESLNSNEIRKFLLKNDISTVVDVIDELHKQGYHLHDIFKKQNINMNYHLDSNDEESNDEESNDHLTSSLDSSLLGKHSSMKHLDSESTFVDASDKVPNSLSNISSSDKNIVEKINDSDFPVLKSTNVSIDCDHRNQIDAAYDTVLDDLQKTRKANKMDDVSSH